MNDKARKYSKEIMNKLKEEGIRVEMDDRRESISKKVRTAQLEKSNYMITIGDKEVKDKKLAIRTRDGKISFGVSIDKFIKDIKKEIEEKC